MPHNIAAHSQRLAAHPHHSAWVAASAGSGKTKVLTDRVLNLLLEGCSPERILCLTFTKAAAAEMSNRLRSRLGEWATLPESDLKSAIEILQALPPTQEKIDRARTLFSLILDTPGGLKIQTIHSFCQALLKRFPLESELSPFFEVTNTTEQMKLIEEANRNVLHSLQFSDDYQSLIRVFHETKFAELNSFILQERESFINLNANAIDQVLGVKNQTEAQLIKHLIQDIPASSLRPGLESLENGSEKDQEKGHSLNQFLNLTMDQKATNYQSYLSLYLTQTGTKRARLVTQKVTQSNPALGEALEKEADRLEDWLKSWKALEVATISKAMAKYSLLFLESYENLKREKSLLDYDDLVLKTSKLLKNPGCHWVLYKLDGGLDHILVDEAQDTNPAQWQVIRAIAEEFYANAAADPRQRTLFIVGDEKQSIYSFQGADPIVFSQMQKDLKDFASGSGQLWEDIDLNVSFRSTPEVLAVVDATFSSASLIPLPLEHLPFRKDARGHVEVWPLIGEEEKSSQRPWEPTITKEDSETPQKQLAQIIALKIKQWLVGNHSFSKPITAGDILILVRRRTNFVDSLIRALKDNEVPVAGLDRLWLLEGIGVQDLLKIAEFLLLPTDDLTLATVLKGPLFNISEEDLFALCYGRDKQSLWERLQDDKRYVSICETLNSLLKSAECSTPYALFSQLLGPLQGRKKWHAQLGLEVLDPLDEFLNLCLDFQDKSTPTLQSFLDWVAQEVIELKRDLEQTDQVRIMTVHGSKGLQAPIVFLPDTTQPPIDVPSFGFYDNTLLWLPPSTKDIPLTEKIKGDLREKQQEEYKRLLYVAMTRAEDALFICGWETPHQNNWYQMMRRGIEKIGEQFDLTDFPSQEKAWKLTSLQSAPFVQEDKAEEKPTFLLPAWLSLPTQSEQAMDTLRPSEVDASPTHRSSGYGSFGTERGTLIHKLLEILPDLPQDMRVKTAFDYLSGRGLSGKQVQEIIQVVENVINTFPDLFTQTSQAEVPLVGVLNGKVLSGKVDRIVYNDSSVLILDYKTHKNVPSSLEQTPSNAIQQLSIYQLALQEIFPSKEILCGLIWTEAPRLDIIPETLLKKFTPSIDDISGKSYTSENNLTNKG